MRIIEYLLERKGLDRIYLTPNEKIFIKYIYESDNQILYYDKCNFNKKDAINLASSLSGKGFILKADTRCGLTDNWHSYLSINPKLKNPRTRISYWIENSIFFILGCLTTYFIPKLSDWLF